MPDQSDRTAFRTAGAAVFLRPSFARSNWSLRILGDRINWTSGSFQLSSYNAPSPRLLHLVQQRLPQCVRVSAMFPEQQSSPGIRHTDFLKRADAPDQPSDAPVNTGVTSRSTGYSARLLRPIKLLTVPASGVGPTLSRDEVRSDRLGLRDRSTDADDHTPGTRPDSTPIRPVPPCRRARSETRRGQAIPPR